MVGFIALKDFSSQGSGVAPHCGAEASLVEHRLLNAGSVVAVPWLSCPLACGIFPGQGSNPCPLHWQADSQPLDCQGNLKMHHSGESEEGELFVANTVIQVLTGLCTKTIPVKTPSVGFLTGTSLCGLTRLKLAGGAWREIQDFSSSLLLNSLPSPS